MDPDKDELSRLFVEKSTICLGQNRRRCFDREEEVQA
jgi:hypothetical protein